MEQATIRYLGKNIPVSKEVADVITKSRRKMKYQSRDIKYERVRVDEARETVSFIPGREDSYDRLLDEKQAEFATGDERIEVSVERKLLCAILPGLIARLGPSEQQLVHMLYWDGKTESVIAAEMRVNQSTVNKRKEKVLGKLLKMLK